MRNKYLFSILAIVIIIMLGYVVFLSGKEKETSKLRTQVNLQNQKLEEIKSKEDGLRNMIPQYISETNRILDEVSPVLPVLKFKSNEEKKILSNAKEWLLGQEGKKALKNEVVLSLDPNGLGDNNLFIINALIYEKPVISSNENEMPTPIGKEYIKIGQIRMKKENGDWKFSQFVDKF
jgi:uncharacterized protein YpmS